jgi:hypothetical protein
VSDTSGFGYGQMTPEDVATEGAVVNFLCRQLIQQLNMMKLVKVVAVHPGSGTAPGPGTVDVQPLVSQIDANGYATAHGTVFGIPIWRLQAGPWALVADPVKGNVGYVVCADRDSSNVVRNAGAVAGPYNPGSRRQYDLADGVYMGGCLNAAPTQYVWLKSDGTLVIVDGHGNTIQTTPNGFQLSDANGNSVQSSPTGLTLTAVTVTVTGNLNVEGGLEVGGTITPISGGTLNFGSSNLQTTGTVAASQVTGGGVPLSTHIHSGVTTGGSDTGPPT